MDYVETDEAGKEAENTAVYKELKDAIKDNPQVQQGLAAAFVDGRLPTPNNGQPDGYVSVSIDRDDGSKRDILVQGQGRSYSITDVHAGGVTDTYIISQRWFDAQHRHREPGKDDVVISKTDALPTISKIAKSLKPPVETAPAGK